MIEQVLADVTRNDVAAAVGGFTVAIIISLFLLVVARLWEGGDRKPDTTENQVGDPL